MPGTSSEQGRGTGGSLAWAGPRSPSASPQGCLSLVAKRGSSHSKAVAGTTHHLPVNRKALVVFEYKVRSALCLQVATIHMKSFS